MAQAQAEATKSAQRAGIDHAKDGKAKDGNKRERQAYLGRKPSFTRSQFNAVRNALQTKGVAQIAKDTGLSRQTVYRIQADPAACEATLTAWGL